MTKWCYLLALCAKCTPFTFISHHMYKEHKKCYKNRQSRENTNRTQNIFKNSIQRDAASRNIENIAIKPKKLFFGVFHTKKRPKSKLTLFGCTNIYKFCFGP